MISYIVKSHASVNQSQNKQANKVSPAQLCQSDAYTTALSQMNCCKGSAVKSC